MITVVNRHTYKGPGLYIGRGTPLGNPYRIGEHGTREQVIEKYRVWLRGQWQANTPAKRELIRLARMHADGEDIFLVCSCRPLPCHADVVKDAIEKIAAAMSVSDAGYEGIVGCDHYEGRSRSPTFTLPVLSICAILRWG